jgi:hypothetical protein
LCEKLRTALQIPVDDAIDTEIPLIDQGVDSLVAVAIRTWFSKQLSLDLPVLKVLGGASVADLAQEAASRLSPSLIPLIKSDEPSSKEETSDGDQVEQPAVAADAINTIASDEVSTVSSPSVRYSPRMDDSPNLSDLETPLTVPSLGAALNEKDNPFEKLSAGTVVRTEPMSFGQARFWLMRHLVEDPTTFNVTIGLWMSGPLNIERLGRAVQTVLDRHETFRTCFFDGNEKHDQPMQGIMASTKARFINVAASSREEAIVGFKQLEKHVYNLESGETAQVVSVR